MDSLEESKARNMRELISAIKMSFEEDMIGGTKDYLLCGLSADYNYNNRLTPEIFLEHFNVAPHELSGISDNEGVRTDYDKAVNALLDSLEKNEENLVILRGPAGSGKSTFVTGFRSIINGTPSVKRSKLIDVQTIRFDCALDDSRYHDASMQFPMGQFISHYEACYKRMEEDQLWKEKYDCVLKKIYEFNNTDYVDNKRGYAGEFVQFLRKNEICSSDSCFKWVKNIKDQNYELVFRQHAVALLVLMLACEIAVKEPKRKYLIFFDNLEMYIFHTDQPINGYAKIAKALKVLFGELPTILNEGHQVFSARGCMLYFSLILCLRTTTRDDDVNYLRVDGTPNQWERNEVRVIDLPTYDFAPLAIQKKLRFLNVHNDLRQYVKAVQDYVKVLYDIDPDELIDDDLATFSTRYYIPFNNHNYRIAILNLGEVTKYRDELKTLEDLLRQHKQVHDVKGYIVNGKRMFAMRSRYEYLRENGFLAELGIEDFAEKHRQSNARVVLNYIFFRKGEIREPRISFFDVKQHINISVDQKFADMADVIAALGPVSCNRIKEETLRKWGALIDISGVNTAQDIVTTLKNALSNNELATKIFLDLTPAGKDYVLNESKQFEYFLFRVTDSRGKPSFKPLFSYLERHDVQKALDAISSVYEVIKDYINNFFIDCANERVCKLASCQKYITDNFGLCVTMLKAFDLFAIIKLNIDYIDRYRCVLIINLLQRIDHGKGRYDHSDLLDVQDVNSMILDEIVKYLGLYDEMKLMLEKSVIGINGESMYDYIRGKTMDIVDQTAFRIIWPQFYWPHYLNNGRKEYPFTKDSDALRTVVDAAKQINILDIDEPTQRLFDAMKKQYDSLI